jgi:hypothetical protein
MNDQLVLLDDNEENDRRYRRLDEHTRDVGRRGIALAREALRHATTSGPAPADGPVAGGRRAA